VGDVLKRFEKTVTFANKGSNCAVVSQQQELLKNCKSEAKESTNAALDGKKGRLAFLKTRRL